MRIKKADFSCIRLPGKDLPQMRAAHHAVTSTPSDYIADKWSEADSAVKHRQYRGTEIFVDSTLDTVWAIWQLNAHKPIL
jgi:hypothetical protein